MPRILIVTSGPLCRNPRVLKEATTLGQAGHEVTVATIANIKRFEDFDRELLAGAPFKVRSLDRVSSSPLAMFAALSERAESWRARRAIPAGRESPTALGPFRALRSLAMGIPADLTIVHTELPFCIGCDLIRNGRRVAADFEDWHSHDLLPSAQSGRPLRLIGASERELMQRSVYTSAPSAAMAAALHGAYGGKMPVVVPNTFPLQAEEPPVPRNNPPSFFWFSQTIGEGRGIEEFLSGWALTNSPSRVCLLGDVSPSYEARLRGLVPEGRKSSLSFLPITSPERLPRVIAGHDIGLALEPRLPESRYLTTTNKIFQYMNAGLAILATETAGQREVLENAPGCGLAIALDDPVALARTLDALVADRERMASMGRASRTGAKSRYCWEKTAPVLLAAVERSLSLEIPTK